MHRYTCMNIHVHNLGNGMNAGDTPRPRTIRCGEGLSLKPYQKLQVLNFSH
jgi:hypothetical protein